MIEQLRQFGETRRGWLGVRIQQVTDEIADSLNLEPARGALVAGVDETRPAKPAGIEAGDVIVKFDGNDIKEMRDLPRIVADTPVGKDVEVRSSARARNSPRPSRSAGSRTTTRSSPPRRRTCDAAPEEKTGREEGARAQPRQHDGRAAQEVQDQGQREGRGDHRRRFRHRRRPTSASSPGDVIVEVAQEAVKTAADLQKRIDQLKKDGRKAALLLVSNAEGELRFVALSLQ